MEAKEVNLQTRHSIALVTSVFVKQSWWFLAIGFGVAYYVRATVGYDRAFEVIFTSSEGLAFIAAIFISVIITKPAADLFYGRELVAEAGKQMSFRGGTKWFPDPSNFYPTMIREIGILRKSAGYVYAMTTTFLSFLMGSGVNEAFYLTFPLVQW
jgi:energy-coupling factor transporter transmembrane protein EcfT